ncbi:hypothetical protein DSCW_18110 [Desulfosarcina widdelii]|uniref:Cyanophage baseplate Pam3 plug gp18 domain-containing protein n=1 Tax=Desulfosarcina widdelii TaxID=947919 RepID=A0A5K7Z7E4_9BACT|nr:hypothetical protein [Desulfosarcina widdelii]BBO74394.1 hypothetical protein DSCW_18110 [Desulfosarcina widdelii]
MGLVALPVAADTPYQSFNIELDGTVYGFRLRYNTRADAWFLDLLAADETVLLAGRAVRLGVDLLAHYSDAAFPPGRLFVVNFVDTYGEPDRENFGQDVKLIYVEAEDE